MIKGKGGPIDKPIYHVEDHKEGPPQKKARVDEGPQKEPEDLVEEQWRPIIETLKSELSKSGVTLWTNPMHPLVKSIQELVPSMRIGAIKAGKGLDRYIMPETGWASEILIRKTVVLLRSTHEIVDLGQGDWTKLTKQQQHRHAKPSHIML